MDNRSRPHNPFRERRVWWTEPGLWVFCFFYLGISGIFILWISRLEFPIAAQVLGVLWIIMFPIIVLMCARVLSEPKVYVKQSVLDRTAATIRDDGKQFRKEFIVRELEELRRGAKCGVLDIWKIDTVLSARHKYFPATRVSQIDPTIWECYIRIQKGAPTRSIAPASLDSIKILQDTDRLSGDHLQR